MLAAVDSPRGSIFPCGGFVVEQLHTTSLLVMHVFQATADGTAGSDILFSTREMGAEQLREATCLSHYYR